MSEFVKGLKSPFRQNDYWHGEQSPGLCFSRSKLEGYYNDLTKKVLDGSDANIDSLIPKVPVGHKNYVHPVTVCQVGLGAYDLFLVSGEQHYLEKAQACADWLVENAISVNGGGTKWVVPYKFELFYMTKPFHSGLVQGQAISLLVRVSNQLSRPNYLDLAVSAYKVLMTPISQGGCRCDGLMAFDEYPSDKHTLVLNGNISAIWGVFDLAKATQDTEVFTSYKNSVSQLIELLPKYVSGKWSRYSLRKNEFIYCDFASPYYHKEHIAQLQVFNQLSPNQQFVDLARQWENGLKSRLLRGYVIGRKGLAVIAQTLLGLRN